MASSVPGSVSIMSGLGVVACMIRDVAVPCSGVCSSCHCKGCCVVNRSEKGRGSDVKNMHGTCGRELSCSLVVRENVWLDSGWPAPQRTDPLQAA